MFHQEASVETIKLIMYMLVPHPIQLSQVIAHAIPQAFAHATSCPIDEMISHARAVVHLITHPIVHVHAVLRSATFYYSFHRGC